MINKIKIRPKFLIFTVVYSIFLYFFYFKYVPVVKSFQLILLPILITIFILTSLKIQWGILFFILSFPLINNLPYFFSIYENIPHAPTALVLFLFFFLGWLVNNSLFESMHNFKYPILKPMFLFSMIIFISVIVTFLRYANFYPFLSGYVYELVTSVKGVSAGGAIMSVVFFSLNYLTGFTLFFILLNTVKSEEFIKKIGIVFCLSIFLALGFGLFQKIINIKIGNSPGVINQGFVNATFKDSLSFGAFIALIVSLMIGILFASKGVIRIFSFLNIILSVYIIFFVGSKVGLFCLIISLLIFILLSFKTILSLARSKSLSQKRIILSSSIAIFSILAIFLTFFIFSEDISESSTIFKLKHKLKPKGLHQKLVRILQGRSDQLWKIGIFMTKDYPLTGVGIGGYIIEAANYSKTYQIPIGTPQSAENYFIQVGSELGSLGLILILWIFWEIIKQIRRSYLKFPNNERNKFILIGAIAGIISFFVNIQFHTYIGSYEIKYTFWLLVALIFSMQRIEKEPEEKSHFSKNFKILSIVLIVIFGAIHLWNSTHSLSLKSRTEQLGLKQDFGLDKLEKTDEGKEFRWTRSYGGQTIRIEKPVIEIPLLASHPDIRKNPVKVKIYLIKDFFKKKKLLDEIILTESIWKTYEYDIPEEVNQEVILLIKVSRTWNPQKVLDVPDPRNLGVAVGKIQFKEKR